MRISDWSSDVCSSDLRAGLKIGDIDLYEVNEAFASVPLAWLKALDADPEKLNINGGAIALGHPLGASGAKLMATMIHALNARGKRYGMRSEEHTSELQSLMRISYDVFCLKKTNKLQAKAHNTTTVNRHHT